MKMTSCLEACVRCARACEECMHAFFGCDDTTPMNGCARLTIDCAQLCWMVAALIGRQSQFVQDLCWVCADVCEHCADQCEPHAVEHYRRCAMECRDCARSCRDLAASLSG